MAIMNVKTVLVFGVFDLLHPGHVYFLNEAIKLGDELHINLASDNFIKNMKNKIPNFGYLEREGMLKKAFPEIIIHKGDDTMGDWSIFKKLNPDIIAIGHDQLDLKKALLNLDLDGVIVDIEPFKKEVYSTTLLA